MILQRLRNLWRLSAFEPGQPTDEYRTPGTIVSSLVQKPQKKAEFISFKRSDPIKELVNEIPE